MCGSLGPHRNTERIKDRTQCTQLTICPWRGCWIFNVDNKKGETLTENIKWNVCARASIVYCLAHLFVSTEHTPPVYQQWPFCPFWSHTFVKQLCPLRQQQNDDFWIGLMQETRSHSNVSTQCPISEKLRPVSHVRNWLFVTRRESRQKINLPQTSFGKTKVCRSTMEALLGVAGVDVSCRKGERERTHGQFL